MLALRASPLKPLKLMTLLIQPMCCIRSKEMVDLAKRKLC